MDLILDDLIILAMCSNVHPTWLDVLYVRINAGKVRLSLPDFDNAISRGSDYKALCGLESGDVGDDVMVAHRKGFWAAARSVLGGAALLFTVDLLVSFKDRREDQLKM